MSTVPTFNSFNNIMPDEIVLNILCQIKGSEFLNIMNSTDIMHNFIEYHMQYIIQQFINLRPYEQFLWETYTQITIEQFKKNLHIQDFVNSNQFEQIIENHNSINSVNSNARETSILESDGITPF